MKFFLILLFGIFSLSYSYAYDAFELSETAKNRTYVGGLEESDLKVLPDSFFSKNKKETAEESSEGF